MLSASDELDQLFDNDSDNSELVSGGERPSYICLHEKHTAFAWINFFILSLFSTHRNVAFVCTAN